MAQGVCAGRLDDAGALACRLERALQSRLVHVMAAFHRRRADRPARRGEGNDILPARAPVPRRDTCAPAHTGIQTATKAGRQIRRVDECRGPAQLRAATAPRSDRGSMVRRSLPPLPSRTVISLRSKSTSLTRSRTHSIRRMPVPYNKLRHQPAPAVHLAKQRGDLVAATAPSATAAAAWPARHRPSTAARRPAPACTGTTTPTTPGSG